MRFQVKAFALSVSIVSGSLSFVLNVLSVLTGFAREFRSSHRSIPATHILFQAL